MTLAPPTSSEPRTRRWTREEFYRLAEQGWFQGQRVLLLDGEIIQMPPMKHPHALAVSRTRDWLLGIFGENHWVRDAMPLSTTGDSDPEPDLAVTEHPMSAYRGHPATAILVVEVSDTSLRLDRRKAAVYAEAGVGEYWILNLNDRSLEVHRSPDPASRSYRETRTLSETDSIAPQARPEAAVTIRDLLP